MVTLSWFAIITMCLAPVFILFFGAGLADVVKHLTTKFSANSSKEIDHEL